MEQETKSELQYELDTLLEFNSMKKCREIVDEKMTMLSQRNFIGGSERDLSKPVFIFRVGASVIEVEAGHSHHEWYNEILPDQLKSFEYKDCPPSVQAEIDQDGDNSYWLDELSDESLDELVKLVHEMDWEVGREYYAIELVENLHEAIGNRIGELQDRVADVEAVEQ